MSKVASKGSKAKQSTKDEDAKIKKSAKNMSDDESCVKSELEDNDVDAIERSDGSGTDDDYEDDSGNVRLKPAAKGKKSGKAVKNGNGKKSRRANSTDDSENGLDEDDDDDYEEKTKKNHKSAGTSKAAKRKTTDSDDDDWKTAKAKKKKAVESGAGSSKKRTGFTKAVAVSSELSAIVGTDTLPRTEIVKRMWAYVRDNNLFDQKNKQYALCDEKLMKVIGTKRFRMFGLMKHLKNHIN